MDNLCDHEKTEKKIKTMQLYNHMDRVSKEIKLFGYDFNYNSSEDTLWNVEKLSKVDSLHYLGNEAIENAIKCINITKDSKVLDIGSGLGGPARVLAHRIKCHVEALELQKDFNEIASKLTNQCGLQNYIQHVHGDFLTLPIQNEKFDKIVSWLVFLHIPNREELISRCYQSLKPGGSIYVEDYFQINSFNEKEKEQLEKDVFVSQLPTKEKTIYDLKKAGFINITFIDMTKSWEKYTTERYNQFCKERERHVQIQGKESVEGLEHFYDSVARLFQGGNLGGIIYYAQRPNIVME